jgi:ABC-type lipoprotein release transport system permease subunit
MMSGKAGIWLRIAWRNLWRNPRRTFITAAALAFGFFAAVTILGISDGIIAQMITNGTGVLTGQIQVHAPDYLPDRSLFDTIDGDGADGIARLVASVEAEPGIVAASPRVYGGGLLSAGDHSVAALLMGADPDVETRVSRIVRTITAGRAPAAGSAEVLIGAELARRLQAAVGDEVVLVAPAADGSLGNGLFTIAGIFETGLTDLDGGWALMPLAALQRLLAIDAGQIHEIAATTAGPWSAPAIAADLDRRLRDAGEPVRARPWTEFRPELADYANLASSANGIIIGIVFAMAIFGVANTMLMGTFERRREFAVVRALGTSARTVVGAVVLEGFMLGAIALAAGALITAPVLVWLHHRPLDLTSLVGGMTLAGAFIRPVLSVEYSVDTPLLAAVALVATALLASVFAAWRAARVSPADAMTAR